MISILVPSIRPYKWMDLYNSAKSVTNHEFEMVFVGPNDLDNKPLNMRFFQDYGSPSRCQQIALIKCTGDLVLHCSDDGVFLPNVLDEAVELSKNYDIVVGKYYEGDPSGDSIHIDNEYYRINHHKGARSSNIPDNYLIFNTGLIKKELAIEIGGWDTIFEACPISHLDMGIRAQRYGAKTILQQPVMFRCSYTPGNQGDHGPIHYAQTEHDEPLFRSIYSDPNCVNRIKIDINNWKNSPERWVRRFG